VWCAHAPKWPASSCSSPSQTRSCARRRSRQRNSGNCDGCQRYKRSRPRLAARGRPCSQRNPSMVSVRQIGVDSRRSALVTLGCLRTPSRPLRTRE
jgi:hypothetical protein